MVFSGAVGTNWVHHAPAPCANLMQSFRTVSGRGVRDPDIKALARGMGHLPALGRELA